MNRNLRRTIQLAVVCVAVLAAAAPASAAVYTLNTCFNGTPPTSTSPWLTAEFKDVFGGVELTLTSSLNVPSEFISEVAFNVNPNILPSAITIVNTTIDDPLVVSVSHSTQNAQKLQGGGSAGFEFDILVKWSEAAHNGGIQRFNGDDIEKFTFAFTGVSAADFDFTNTGGANAHLGAHIQGIPDNTGGTTSGAIKDGSVPEPCTLAIWSLLGVCGMGIGWRRRKQTA